MTYLWLKAGHIIFVIFWMAGLFMLPRYFVYHQEAPEGSDEAAKWVDRERKLLQDHPAAVDHRRLGARRCAGFSTIGPGTRAGSMPSCCWCWSCRGYHGWLVGYAKKLARGERPLDGKTLAPAQRSSGHRRWR